MSPHLFYNTYHHIHYDSVSTPLVQHLSSHVITVCHHTSFTTLIITYHYGMSPHLFYNTYYHMSSRYVNPPLLQHLSSHVITICHHTSSTTLIIIHLCHYGMSPHLFYNTYHHLSLRYVTTPLLQQLSLRFVTTHLLQHLSSHVITVCHHTSSTTLIITYH